MLTIKAERRFDYREGDDVIAAERLHGAFTRQLFLGDMLDAADGAGTVCSAARQPALGRDRVAQLALGALAASLAELPQAPTAARLWVLVTSSPTAAKLVVLLRRGRHDHRRRPRRCVERPAMPVCWLADGPWRLCQRPNGGRGGPTASIAVVQSPESE